MLKKVVYSLLAFLLLISGSINAFAHENVLNIDYDECIIPTDEDGNTNIQDGEDEMWYCIASVNDAKNNVFCEYHLYESITTIKYYFEPFAEDGSGYSWNTEVSEETANEIKQAYADSMKKWNNVFYYSYGENGNRIAKKIINITEGTESDHNLSIYPIDYCDFKDQTQNSVTYIAATATDDSMGETFLPTSDSGMLHRHYSHWKMYVNINYFYAHGEIGEKGDPYYVGNILSATASVVRERTGAHELGHILGIQDVDNLCSSQDEDDHHQEVLMGYGSPLTLRTIYPTYKDIAGVSITRGFHTDADHKWMLRTRDDGSTYLICSLCNGIRTEFTLTNGIYEGQTPVVYGSCNDNHSLTSGNMLLVATDGTRDFYKCLKCRHIEEVDHVHAFAWENHEHTHTGTCVNCFYSFSEYHDLCFGSFNSENHIAICDTCQATAFYPHSFECTYIDGDTHTSVCRYCGYAIVQSHTYEYKSLNSDYHKLTCSCGATSGGNSPHIWTTSATNPGFVECKLCKYLKRSAGGNIPIIKEKPPIIEEVTE